jgi:glycosyltransferase involved in cell wall biosynthesis
VEAFEQLDPEWKLVLAGSSDSIRKRRANASNAARANRTSRCSATSPIPELEELYRRASIFAFPSLDEGFGMPVLDAMARGVPVLTSNVSAMPEVAGDALSWWTPPMSRRSRTDSAA